jgi:N-dimethylarginine dimethylaminohydrolase
MAQGLLMCPPDYFGVQYSINPWMKSQRGKVDIRLARQQWQDYYSLLHRFAKIRLMDPESHVPDLVFTANAGLILGNKFVPSKFRHQERRSEEPLFRKWFLSQEYQVIALPDSIHFEGAGDVLQQPGKNLLWAGHGFRSDLTAHAILKKDFHIQVISLRLVDPRFYHLDTCFCPLQEGGVMYYPQAFDLKSLKLIEEKTVPENRILVSEEDAIHFSCNAVLLDKNIIMNHASAKLENQLKNAGYTVFISPVTEFMKAGGANKCLTFELDPFQENEKRGHEKNKMPLAV